jgi:RNA polymerase sigma factor (sigma-70 family)
MDETLRIPFDAWKARPSSGGLVALLEASRPLVLLLCHQVLRHPQDAEDAAQLVLLELIDKLDEIKDAAHCRHWIYRASLHVALNLKRSRSRRKEHERQKAERSAEALPSENPADCVYDHLARLDAESRALIVSRYLERRSVQELAASSGCSTVTLWKRLEKAREELLQALARSGLAMALPDVDAVLDSSLPAPAFRGGLGKAVLAKTSTVSALTAAGAAKFSSLAAALLLGLAGGTVLTTASLRSRQEPRMDLVRIRDAGHSSGSTGAAGTTFKSTATFQHAETDHQDSSSEEVTEVTAVSVSPALVQEDVPQSPGTPILPSILRFMKSQNEDGSWGDGVTMLGDRVVGRAGVTSLALLSFLGAGYCQLSKDVYDGRDTGVTVRRALDYLSKNFRDDGSVSSDGDPVLDQALSSLALSESYGMTASWKLKEPAQKGIEALLKLQQSDGSWSHPTSTYWAMEALASALYAEIPLDAEQVQRTKNYMRSQLDAGPNLPAMIGYLFLSQDRQHPGLLQTRQAVSTVPPDRGGTDLLYCYQGGMALFRYEGPDGNNWKPWAESLRQTLQNSQQGGFWQGTTQSDTIVRSSLATFSLEMVYRYYNTFSAQQTGAR